MTSEGYSFLFGPVRSRRLGRSLGIDLVPLKVCTYDCPYCQVGQTTDKTLVRRDYVPVEEVVSEFDRWLARDGQADCVTLAGGGEPTLHSRFGDVIDAIGARCGLRRILLSNGSLFSLPEVRAAAIKAEVVKATLSAWDQASYQHLHHPHPSLEFVRYVEGLKAFRKEYRGEYWLEVFVVPGLNESPEAMARIAALAAAIAPDRIHLNTAVRPAWETSIRPVSAAHMNELARLFSPVAEVVGAAAEPAAPVGAVAPGTEIDRIMGLIRRHPCTPTDVAVSLGMDVAGAKAALETLVARGVLRVDNGFFVAV